MTGAGALLKYAAATHKGSEGPLEGSPDLGDLERPSKYEDTAVLVLRAVLKNMHEPRGIAHPALTELTDKHSEQTHPRFAV